MTAAATPLLVTADRLVDGSGGDPIRGGAVLVRGERIERVGRQGDSWPAGARRASFADATLLPGLIDAHVHLCFDGSAAPAERLEGITPAALDQLMARSAARALAAGVTTVRDCGCLDDAIFRFRGLVESGQTDGPTILAAGRPLTIPMGHCWFLGGVAHDQAELLGLVRQEVERGADLLKIMATGGAMTPTSDPNRPQFPAAWLRAAVELAHSLGRPVAAHGHTRQGILEAVEAGVDTVEHATFLTETGPSISDADLATLAASGVTAVPTLTPLGLGARAGEPSRLAKERGLSAADMWGLRKQLVERFRSAGVPMIAGSDCGVGHVPHDSVLLEVEFLHEAGLPRAEALLAATGRAADALGVADRVGRLAPGRVADMLVVAGDPLSDLSALRRPLAVFQRGRRVAAAADDPASNLSDAG
jgi:imidazolonepropionase-like amidohydrolase